MKRVDHNTEVLIVPGGLLFMRTVNVYGGVSTHMLLVPCNSVEAEKFMGALKS